METLKQAELPLKKFSKRTIGIILVSAIFLGLGSALAIASALPTEGEKAAMEIYNLKLQMEELHLEAESLRAEWADLNETVQTLEEGLFQ